jgi:hypothetical protein
MSVICSFFRWRFPRSVQSRSLALLAAAKMTALFGLMCESALKAIAADWKLAPETVRLVSGGSAWADHVAVRLYLDSVCGDDNWFNTASAL